MRASLGLNLSKWRPPVSHCSSWQNKNSSTVQTGRCCFVKTQKRPRFPGIQCCFTQHAECLSKGACGVKRATEVTNGECKTLWTHLTPLSFYLCVCSDGQINSSSHIHSYWSSLALHFLTRAAGRLMPSWQSECIWNFLNYLKNMKCRLFDVDLGWEQSISNLESAASLCTVGNLHSKRALVFRL